MVGGGRHRRRAGRVFATAAAGLALCAADAAAARIESDPLTVEIDDLGAANGFTTDGRRVFEGADPALRLRLAGGDVLGPSRTGGTSGPVVRDGAVQRQVTTYRLGPFAVEQTTSVRDGDVGYGIRWRLRNTGAVPLAFRLGAVGHLDGFADYTPTFERVPARFVGARERSTGEVRGFAEEPGDPWSAWRHGYAPSVLSWFDTDPGAGGSASPGGDPATIVAWDDRTAPGASVVHALRVELQHGPRISISDPPRAILGSPWVLRVQARDAAGAPMDGAALRVIDWGASRAASPAVTTGADGGADLPVTGERAGAGHVAVWLDGDGDGRLGATEPRAIADTHWVPRLVIDGPGQAWTGMVRAVGVTLYDADGGFDDSVLRWRVEGAHPNEFSGRTFEGEAALGIAGEREGEDRVSVYADLDEDGFWDADEPAGETTVTWHRPGPGLRLLADTLTPATGSTLGLAVSVRDGSDRPVDRASLRWSSEGANVDGLSFTVIGGSVPFTWHGDESGASTATVAHDADGDGFEPGDPRASVDVTWQPPPRFEPPDGAQVLPAFSEAAPEQDGNDAQPSDPGSQAGLADGTGTSAGAGEGGGAPPTAGATGGEPVLAAPARVRIGRVAPAGRSGLRVALRCPAAAAAACRGTVTVRDRAGRKRLGRVRYRIAPGHTGTVRVALRARPRVVRVSVAGSARGVLRRTTR